MLLVLGQPGSGCSTLLKVLGNQRAGYQSIEGDVTYGGADAKTMAQNYKSEGIFVPLIISPLIVRNVSYLCARFSTIQPGR